MLVAKSHEVFQTERYKTISERMDLMTMEDFIFELAFYNYQIKILGITHDFYFKEKIFNSRYVAFNTRCTRRHNTCGSLLR